MTLPGLVRAARERSLFFLLMGGGASLGLLRSFVVAGFLSAIDFGIYAAAVAIALFLSPFLGFGRIEETRKLYPRLFSDGRTDEIAPHAVHLVAILGLRIGALTAAGSALAWLVKDAQPWWVVVLSAGLIAFNQAGMAVLISALRAGTNTINLAIAAFARSVGSLAFAIFGAFAIGLPGALLGEGVGGLIGLVLAWRMLPRTRAASSTERQKGPALSRLGRYSPDGLRLLLGTMAISLPVYLSRPVVGAIYDLEQLGTFAFLMLFASGALAGYGIVDQLAGPSLVRMQRVGASYDQQLRRLLVVMGAAGLLMLGFLAAAFVALQHPMLEFYVAKYGLEWALISPAIIFAVLQFTSTTDWFLIANDRERAVLRAALLYVVAFGALSLVTALLKPPLEVFLWGLAMAKLCQLLVAWLFVSKIGVAEGRVPGR